MQQSLRTKDPATAKLLALRFCLDLATGNTGPFLTLAEAEAMELGVNLGADGWLSPESPTLRGTCQKAYLKAWMT